MTRPVGKSLASSKSSRPQLDPNPVSLIDVGAEDDSLISVKGKAFAQKSLGPVTQSRPVASPFKAYGGKSLACIQEDQPDGEQMLGIAEDEAQDVLAPLATDEPAVKKKKKKTGFNLRKSLAWNNAFFTEEGVLDPEELSLVNRTFKKPAEEPKPSSNKKPALSAKFLNPSAISKLSFSPVRFQKPPVQADKRHKSTAGSSPLNALKKTDPHSVAVKGFAASKHGLGGFSRLPADLGKQEKSMASNRPEVPGLKPSPQKKQIEETVRTAVPAYSSPKPPLDRSKHTQSLASTLSSASKRMKDRLGMVFSSRTMGNVKSDSKSTADDGGVIPSSTAATEYSDSAKLSRCYSHTSYDRFGRLAPLEPAISKLGVFSSSTNMESRVSHAQRDFDDKSASALMYTGFSPSVGPKPSIEYSKESTSASILAQAQSLSSFTRPPKPHNLPDLQSISKETCNSEGLLSRAKPSGLRMPSPKMGFFDKPKTTNAAHISVLRERTNGLGYGNASLQHSRSIGATSRQPLDFGGMGNMGKQSNDYLLQSFRSTGRQPAENVTVNNHTKQMSMLKPPVPATNLNQSLLDTARQSNPANVLSSIPSAPHVRHMESSSKPVTISMQRPAALSAIPSQILNTSMLHGPSSSGSSSAMSRPQSNASCRTGSQVLEKDSQASETGAVLQVQKNAQNILPPPSKRASNPLNLSPLRIDTGQENLLLELVQDRESQRGSLEKRGTLSNEDIGGGSLATVTQEEWPQSKSGAVQHSPPNKEPPKFGPWSPVRRNAPELGPFDCTKYINTGSLH